MRMWLVREVMHTLLPLARPKFVATRRANTPTVLSILYFINTYDIAIF